MNTFYPHKGSRKEALKGGIEYDSFEDLTKIVTEIFYSGDVRLVHFEFPITSECFTQMVTLNFNAVGYIAEGEK